LFSTLIFPLYKMNRLEFSCFVDLFVCIYLCFSFKKIDREKTLIACTVAKDSSHFSN
jgi:hypothetical protein